MLFVTIGKHPLGGLVQERRNSIANTLELRLSCITSIEPINFDSNICFYFDKKK